MPFVVFQSIENPEKVCQIAKNARDEVIRETNSKMYGDINTNKIDVTTEL